MNLLSGQTNLIDATTQTDITEPATSYCRGRFQGYEVDYEQGRSIVVNCMAHNRVTFAPQPNSDTVVIDVEPVSDQEPMTTTTRSYAVNLVSPFDNRFSVSDASSTDLLPLRDSDTPSLSPFSGRPQLVRQPSTDTLLSVQSQSSGYLMGSWIPSLSNAESIACDRQSVNSTDSTERSVSGPVCRFRYGSRIRAIAAQIGNASQATEQVSELILNKLNTYNPGNPPLWYRNKYNLSAVSVWQSGSGSIANSCLAFKGVTVFMLNCFAKWTGWTDEAGKCKKVIAESEVCLDARFLLFLQNDTNGFERLSEVSQIIACVERDICESFQGRSKGDDVITIYETLSFNNLGGQSRKDFNQSAIRDGKGCKFRCNAGVIFFFRELCQMIKEAESFDKYQNRRKEILAKCARLGLMHVDQSASKIALLIACVNYNLAVYLIEKEYLRADLSEFDAARRVDGRLSASTDYDRFTDDDLDIMQGLLKLINALEQEVQELLQIHEKEINRQPRLKDRRSFEQRVLHLIPDDSGYISEPLKGIKATLSSILDRRPLSSSQV